MNNNEVSIAREWQTIEDYQYKILVLISVLAENDLAFRGSLDTMCKWLGIKNCSKNTKPIKEAIAELEKKQYIFYNKEGQTHHISITNKGLKDKRIVKIKRQWLEAIRTYGTTAEKPINRSWHTMTKALVSIIDRLEQDRKEKLFDTSTIIITMRELGEDIQRGEETAGTIARKLTECNFEDGLTIEKAPLIIQYNNNFNQKKYKTLGTEIKVNMNWEE